MLFKRLSSSMSSTIYALSSGHRTCGVAVIRISGAQAGHALLRMTGRTKLPMPRQANLNKIIDPESNEVLDHALTLWFPGPKSFTGEDSAELQVHGGQAVIKGVLSGLSKIKGLRPAQAGDFTKRAFQSGKLDLTQVEGLADLIHAETDQQRKLALQHMDGSLMKQFHKLRSDLISIMAKIEAYIDFAESEDIEDSTPEEAKAQALVLVEAMTRILDQAKKSERIRSGVKIAIIGKPNVGKSTLLNHLVQRPVAIVSSIAGTTRDILETRLDLNGYPVTIIDTAGIRFKTSDMIEQEGVKRAIEAANQADVLVLVQDHMDHPDLGLDEFGLEPKADQVKIRLVNKVDLLPDFDHAQALGVSGLTGQGMDKFLDELSHYAKILCDSDCPGLTRDRHVLHVTKALEFLLKFLENEQDLLIGAHFLRRAVQEIGHISGKVSSDKILDVIFADFCIGK